MHSISDITAFFKHLLIHQIFFQRIIINEYVNINIKAESASHILVNKLSQLINNLSKGPQLSLAVFIAYQFVSFTIAIKSFQNLVCRIMPISISSSHGINPLCLMAPINLPKWSLYLIPFSLQYWSTYFKISN